jgi:hypothetical protein
MQLGTRTRLAVAASVGALVIVGPLAAVSQGQTRHASGEPDPALCAAAKKAIADLERLDADLKHAEGQGAAWSVFALKQMVAKTKALIATYDADLKKNCGI